jgi:hypothetical protein
MDPPALTAGELVALKAAVQRPLRETGVAANWTWQVVR